MKGEVANFLKIVLIFFGFFSTVNSELRFLDDKHPYIEQLQLQKERGFKIDELITFLQAQYDAGYLNFSDFTSYPKEINFTEVNELKEKRDSTDHESKKGMFKTLLDRAEKAIVSKLLYGIEKILGNVTQNVYDEVETNIKQGKFKKAFEVLYKYEKGNK